jgi:hypothetical protein
MASFLDMLRQQQAQPQQSFIPDFAPAVNGLLQGYLQGDQMRRQREQDAIAAEERKRKAEAEQYTRDKERFDTALKMGNTAMSAGNNETAATILDQLQSGGMLERFAGIQGPKVMGATVTDPAAVNRQQSAMAFANPLGMLGMAMDPSAMDQVAGALTAPTTKRDYSGQASTNALASVFGPAKSVEVSPGASLMTSSGQVLGTAPGRPASERAPVQWDTRQADDGTYFQINPVTGETRSTDRRGRLPGQENSAVVEREDRKLRMQIDKDADTWARQEALRRAKGEAPQLDSRNRPTGKTQQIDKRGVYDYWYPRLKEQRRQELMQQAGIGESASQPANVQPSAGPSPQTGGIDPAAVLSDLRALGQKLKGGKL